MEDSGQTEVEVELYEEIVDLNFSTPMSSRAPSPFLLLGRPVNRYYIPRAHHKFQWERSS